MPLSFFKVLGVPKTLKNDDTGPCGLVLVFAGHSKILSVWSCVSDNVFLIMCFRAYGCGSGPMLKTSSDHKSKSATTSPIHSPSR